MTSKIDVLLAGYPVVVVQAVAWGEMDSYEHVNNVTYFRYFENARVAYLRRLGWPELEQETGIGPIVAALSARFRRPLNFPDTISIGTRLDTLGDDRFSVKHIIVSHTLAAVTTEGQGTVVTYDYAAQRKAPIPEKMRQRILELEGLSATS